MQFLEKIQSYILPHCHWLNNLISNKTGINPQIHTYCSFVSEIHDFKFQLVLGLALFLVLSVLLFFMRKTNNSPKTFFAKLVNIKEISHDTKIFTFDLPEGINKIGLNIGQHLELEAEIDGKTVARKYTPISRADVKRNSFELLIKIYYKQPPQFPEGGIMTQYIGSLKLGDKIKVTLPYGRFNYLGKSNVQIKQLNGTVRRSKVDRIYMVGGGTGITPLYQIIQYVTEAEHPADRPALSLLFANRTEDDILVKSELQAFEKENTTFKAYFSVDKSIREGWKGFVGYIDQEKIGKLVGENNLEKSLFVVCGPPVLCNIVQKVLLSKFKIKPEQFFRF